VAQIEVKTSVLIAWAPGSLLLQYGCIWYIRNIYLTTLYSFFAQRQVTRKTIYTVYILISFHMVRRMKAKFTQIESVVTPSGNSGHVVVPKAWIGREAIVTLKGKESKGKGKK
jgi:putative transposon-encoded protein